MRVIALVNSGPENVVSSQRVAATFSLALRGVVPTQGWSMPGTGGRSASTSREGCLPTGTGEESCTLGVVEHAPASGSVQRPETALASRPALGPRSGSLAGSVIPVRVSTTVVVSPPVRATPTTWVVTGSAQLRSTSSVASSPTPSTRCVDSSWTRGLAQAAYHPSVVA